MQRRRAGYPATMTVSNVLLSASTLQLADAIATPFHVLNAFTLTSGATLVITNSAIQFDGAGGLAIGTSATSPCAVWMLDGMLVGTNWVGSRLSRLLLAKVVSVRWRSPTARCRPGSSMWATVLLRKER